MLGRVVPFESLRETAHLGGRERLVERRGRMGVQVVLDQDDLFRGREAALRDNLPAWAGS